MANLIFNNNNKKTITQQLVLKGSGLPQAQTDAPRGNIVSRGQVVGGDSKFWTNELLSKMNCFNYKSGNDIDALKEYQELKGDAKASYEKRKFALQALRKAIKTGN